MKPKGKYHFLTHSAIDDKSKDQEETRWAKNPAPSTHAGLRANTTTHRTRGSTIKKRSKAASIVVAANAQVFLAGNLTKMTGLTRTYTTQKLSAGQDWSGYVVRVAIERNGRTLDQERVITLNAGQQHELSFDFDTDKLASAAR